MSIRLNDVEHMLEDEATIFIKKDPGDEKDDEQDEV